MPDPQDPRGEASEPDVSQPEAPRAESSGAEVSGAGEDASSADGTPTPGASAETPDSSGGAGEQAWPTEDEAAEAVASPPDTQDGSWGGAAEDGVAEDRVAEGGTDPEGLAEDEPPQQNPREDPQVDSQLDPREELDPREGLGPREGKASREDEVPEEQVPGDGPDTTPHRVTAAGVVRQKADPSDGPIARSESGELEPAAAGQGSSEPDSGEGWPTDEQATLAMGTAPEAGVEGTQQIPRVDETRRIPKVEAGTDRFDRREQAQSGQPQSGQPQPSQPQPGQDRPEQDRPEQAAEQTRQIPRVDETQRIPKVQAASSPPPVEQPTEQMTPVGASAAPERPRSQQDPAEDQRFAEAHDFDEYAAPGPAGASAEERTSAPARDDGPEDFGAGERPRRKKRGLLAAVALVVVVGAGIALAIGGSGGITALRTPSPPPPVQLNPAIKPAGNNGPVPQEQALNAALAGPLANPALGSLGGTVLDAETGRPLWQRDAAQAKTPASTGKLLAMSASMLALDHQQRFTTKVVRGPEPGSVVLVGGGDPTLSSLPAGQESVYPGAAHLDDLAAQVKAATGGQVTSISVDTSRYKGPPMAPGWMDEDVAGGSTAPIEPVMVDGGRANPNQDVSPRGKDPAMQAGRKLAERLGVPGSSVSGGSAPGNAPQLGAVRSATVQQMVETGLRHSDNVLTEALAREVALTTGNEPSFAGASKAVRDVLGREGVPLNGISMVDGSGLSPQDRIPPENLAKLLATASAPAQQGGDQERTRKLRGLLPGLPVAGGSGSLEDRFQGSPGRGWVRAKTGTLNGANSLAGTVLTEDGRLLVFSFLTNGTNSTSARPALDEVATALRGCGCS